jgi:hypothetical protein
MYERKNRNGRIKDAIEERASPAILLSPFSFFHVLLGCFPRFLLLGEMFLPFFSSSSFLLRVMLASLLLLDLLVDHSLFFFVLRCSRLSFLPSAGDAHAAAFAWICWLITPCVFYMFSPFFSSVSFLPLVMLVPLLSLESAG